MSTPEVFSPSQPSPLTAETIKSRNTEEEGGGGSMVTEWKQRRVSIISKTSTGVPSDEPKPPVSLRRRSTFKGIATSITSMLSIRRATKGRLSIPGPEELKPKPKLENTYKMKPDDGKVFPEKQVECIAYEVMERHLQNEKYNAASCNRMVCDISQSIQNRIKGLNIPRYRIVVHVVIGQCNDQGLQMSSRSIWDVSTDNYSTAIYKNDSLFAVSNVYGIYFE